MVTDIIRKSADTADSVVSKSMELTEATTGHKKTQEEMEVQMEMDATEKFIKGSVRAATKSAHSFSMTWDDNTSPKKVIENEVEL